VTIAPVRVSSNSGPCSSVTRSLSARIMGSS
jgi:hypothetical protein